jgi:PhnB protein
MATLNPYLNFPGNTEEAFNFYKSVFGGEFLGGISRFKDTPEGSKMSAADGEKVMHVALPIGRGNILMATDAMESMGQKLTVGNNFYLSLEADSKEEAEKLFVKLSAGGKIEMPLGDAPWGAYFGMFADQFGVQWMVNYTYKK